MSKVVRSKAYPSMNLSEAVKRVEQIASRLGAGSFSRDELVIGMGYKGLSGASGRAVAALVHFGLLDRAGANYSLSRLGHAIAYPSDSSAKAEAIKEAVLKPAIIREVYEQYQNQQLPSNEFLANILTTDRYGINPRQKDEVASVIVESLQFAGDLTSTEPIDDVAEPTDNNAQDELRGTAQSRQVLEIGDDRSVDLNKIEIVLREGVRAGIYAPHNLTVEEKNKLKSIIDLL